MNVDSELIKGCINGERRAEYELYKVVYSYLMSICYRYTHQKELAEEMLNIGYLKILTHLSKYDETMPFKSWIRRIMVNTLIDEYRKNKALKSKISFVEEYYDSNEYYHTNSAIENINAKEILKMIEKLPRASAQVFNLYAIDGFSHKEIADMLEISEGTSKWHLNFARHKLMEMVNKSILTTAKAS
jgi:RNA polymerase sigma-70 factor (ECF subfamily)